MEFTLSNILFHVTKSFHISVTIWKTTIFGVNLHLNAH
ncbi:hypothetical protein UUU_12290 [Klebsiella pneumoniae subsp. pneumoniae DSM 30104 = JCM 1662 = NBRC 14940]|nr:hypothetical protein CSB99_3980 [Klebsiella pneumoniae]EJK91888.1 hypothetical protein UUU_12290 [Klebsiella pneumoniae subsp. pneumoniae DSM 30104 = JCM 1662 = NBRC 14940]EPB31279.1 hypothetical protein H216_3748 [Klebsiella pneumoniae DMC0526]EPO30686.1 hypothetical protein H219_3420 [Klebsiella pneumoniae DMC1316]EPS12646.1 hypothetical protein KKPNMP14_14350 [Klebsiella pneumoniae subsp. pneumoniae MP14]